MRRVVRHMPHPLAAVALATTISLLAGAIVAPVAAQELPPCEDGRTSDCQLPDWEDAAAPELPSLFGEVDGLVWLADAAGDAPPAGLDILGAGIGTVEVTDPAAVRASEALLKRGKRKQAVRGGTHYLVRVQLDRPLDALADGHAGVHVATDINGSRGSNAPSGVRDADNPFAGSQDVYSATYASTTGKTKLHDSDLSRAWYKGKDAFAAAWASPEVLDLLIPRQAFGGDFRVVSFVSGEDGGYDRLSLGPAAIPVDGAVGLVPRCVEGSVAPEPFVVRRLFENGQRLKNVDTPASWRGGATFPVDGDTRDALRRLIDEADLDDDGAATIAATVHLFEDGQVLRQRTDFKVGLSDDGAALWTELGLLRRGYSFLRDISLDDTGDAVADAWLDTAETSLKRHLPPFRSTRSGGLVLGDGVGACIEAFAPPPPADEPATDA